MDGGFAAPRGPSDFYERYFGYVRRIVSNTPAIPAQDVEDVTMEIFTRLLERNVLAMFDPGMTFEHGGKQIPARFRTFLVAQVSQYVKGQRDKIGRISKRELLIYDTPPDGDDMSWAEQNGGSVTDDYSGIDARDYADRVRELLRMETTWQPKSRRDHKDLVAVWDQMLAQLNKDGKVTKATLAESLGVSAHTASGLLESVRGVARQEATLSRRIQLAGVTYTVAHVRQASRLLKAVTGQPHVRQPLERARNPLAGMDYHGIARAEQAEFPAVKLPPGDHHKPAGHVLSAVVHRLDRLAAPGAA